MSSHSPSKICLTAVTVTQKDHCDIVSALALKLMHILGLILPLRGQIVHSTLNLRL